MTGSPSEASTEAPSVARRAVQGAAWLTVARALAHGLRALRLLFLAYLLGGDGPTELGIFGVAMLVMQTAEALSQTGLSQALIQRSGDLAPYLRTAWTSQLVRGVVLALILYLGAPWFASLFEKPDAEAPLRALAVVPLLRGLTSVGVVFFQKELAFRKVFVMDVGVSVVDLTVCCVLAAIEPDVWALVWGQIAGGAYGLVASYVLADRHAGLGFSLARVRELSGFGAWVFLASLVTFALMSGGDAVVGKLLPAAALGIYQMASRLSNLPAFELSRIITTISFPALSLLKQDPERMKRAFLKAYLFSSVLSLAVAGGVVAVAPDLVAVLLPAQWAQVAPVMQLLAVWGATRGLSGSQLALFYAAGRPGVPTLVRAGMLLLFAALVLPVVDTFGVVGVAALYAVIGTIPQLAIYPFTARLAGVPAGAVLLRTLSAVSAPAVGLCLALALQSISGDLTPWVRLVVTAVVYGGGVALTLAAWQRLTTLGVGPTLAEIWRAVRRRPA